MANATEYQTARPGLVCGLWYLQDLPIQKILCQTFVRRGGDSELACMLFGKQMSYRAILKLGWKCREGIWNNTIMVLKM